MGVRDWMFSNSTMWAGGSIEALRSALTRETAEYEIAAIFCCDDTSLRVRLLNRTSA